MTPQDYYHQQLTTGRIIEDQNQLQVLSILQTLHQQLTIENKKRSSWTHYFRKKRPIKGCYIWGGVGIGKTFLMDCFFHTLSFQEKTRMHFHSFMQHVHNDLTALQGHKNPLMLIAKNWAKKVMVLCFDEFLVTDITDAMLLKGLLKELFNQGITLVTTSNTAPDNLYKNGLQRELFLPAIDLIKSNTTVIDLPSTTDYRLRHLKEAGVFYTPLDEKAKNSMEKTFDVLTQNKTIKKDPIELYGRLIQIVKRTEDIIWFDFNEICSIPRSQKDYLALSEQFETVFISNIPLISEKDRDRICLFMSLIDVLYDARIKLIISSEEPVETLYNRGQEIAGYTRTHSRLLEMQSVDYFAGEFNIGSHYRKLSDEL